MSMTDADAATGLRDIYIGGHRRPGPRIDGRVTGEE